MKMESSVKAMRQKTERTAWEAALFLLRARTQSEQEIRMKLHRRGYAPDEIDTAVERLYEFKYLNDGELAENLFQHYRKNCLYGDIYIQNKLKSRGLFIEEHLTEEEEVDKAREAYRRKKEIVPSIRSNYRRAAAFLLRRGFSPSVIFAVIGEEE